MGNDTLRNNSFWSTTSIEFPPSTITTMSAPKYQPVPARDSFEEPPVSANYNQNAPPPSYQQEPVMGEARDEEDNLPDDFKFGGSVAEATLPIRMQFIRKVYAILTVQILATTALSAVSFWSSGYRNWIQSNSWMMWVSLFGAIGFMLLTFWKRKSYPTNLLFLAGFTGLEAYSISVVTSFYESRIVIQALIFTLGIFVALDPDHLRLHGGLLPAVERRRARLWHRQRADLLGVYPGGYTAGHEALSRRGGDCCRH